MLKNNAIICKQQILLKVELQLGSLATGKLSTQQQMGTFYESGKDKAVKRGMGSAFHRLWPRYSGPIIPTFPTTTRL